MWEGSTSEGRRDAARGTLPSGCLAPDNSVTYLSPLERRDLCETPKSL
jgi:hypothetical protein